ncbi:unnamed protein product [Closterium sp. NIES-64]|nr:unnamed protein product [Closterium sp. NIES-64]
MARPGIRGGGAGSAGAAGPRIRGGGAGSAGAAGPRDQGRRGREIRGGGAARSGAAGPCALGRRGREIRDGGAVSAGAAGPRIRGGGAGSAGAAGPLCYFSYLFLLFPAHHHHTMAPPGANMSAAAAAAATTAAGGVLKKQGSEPVTQRTLFNGVQGPFGVKVVNELSAKTSALRINDLPGEKRDKLVSTRANQPSTPDVKGKEKEATKEAKEDEGYLSDDPDECQDPDAISAIAAQAGFAIMLLIPAKWIEEVPHAIDTEYLKERLTKPGAIEVLLRNVPAVITPEMIRKSLVTATLLKRKRTAFLEGFFFHMVVDPVTWSDTDKVKGLVYRHPGDKYKWWDG